MQFAACLDDEPLLAAIQKKEDSLRKQLKTKRRLPHGETRVNEKRMKELRLQIEKNGRFMGFTLADDEEPANGSYERKNRMHQKYDPQEEEEASWAPRIRRLDDLTRVTFLITLDRETCLKLMLPGSRIWHENAHGSNRSVNLSNPENFWDILEAGDIRATISKDYYDNAQFRNVFRFTNSYIDLPSSSPLARWWAKNMFVDLAGYVKTIIDVEEERGVRQTARRVL
ncbi:hypothetical protein NX059_010768 [Plenodomus lindquistii]|nr:hypothetical protein NX059_010768 [Plenodomus lindquistii]